MQIELLFLCYNRVGIVSRCFRSLLPTLAQGVKWTVLDNASRDNTPNWLMKLATRYNNIDITLSAVNYGVAGGRERLLRQATGDILAFLDSDIEALNPDWLSMLVQPLVDNPQIGLCGVGGHYVNQDWTLTQAPQNYTGEVDVCSGFCQVFRRADLADFKMDMSFNGRGAEDDDTCLFLKSKGLQVHQIANTGVKHIYSGTWVTSNDGYLKARKYLQTKWGNKGLLLCERERVT